jgi:flagellar biosynthesis regulator FlbT
MYKALKESRRLIAYEQELLDNATRRAGLRKRGKTDVDAA